MSDKKLYIQNFFNKHNLSISLDLDDQSIDIVYQLCMYDTIVETSLTTNCAVYVGTYYLEIKKDIKKALKFFSMTTGDVLCELAFRYQESHKYDKMLKYYLKAIKQNNTKSMIMLAHYYYTMEDEVNMLKYLTMAIEYGDTNAMHNLAVYYHEKQNEEQTIKCLQMAINGGSINSMYHLALYYEERQDYQSMAKYCFMALYYNPEYTAAKLKIEKYFNQSEIESLKSLYIDGLESN